MDLSFSDLMRMQETLQEKYLEKWGGLYPEKAKSMLLWSLIEAGEAAVIIKKKGDAAILNDPQTRHDYAEEISDTIMYLMDSLLCYGITAEELSEIYNAKFKRNLHRWD